MEWMTRRESLPSRSRAGLPIHQNPDKLFLLRVDKAREREVVLVVDKGQVCEVDKAHRQHVHLEHRQEATAMLPRPCFQRV